MTQRPPATTVVADHAIRYKMLLGLAFCVLYAAAYAGFVAIAVYDVTLMDIRMPFGVNLGVFYGFGLILLAFSLGVAYNCACAMREKSSSLSPGGAAPQASVTKGSASR